jgi:hypothetical protein
MMGWMIQKVQGEAIITIIQSRIHPRRVSDLGFPRVSGRSGANLIKNDHDDDNMATTTTNKVTQAPRNDYKPHCSYAIYNLPTA